MYAVYYLKYWLLSCMITNCIVPFHINEYQVWTQKTTGIFTPSPQSIFNECYLYIVSALHCRVSAVMNGYNDVFTNLCSDVPTASSLFISLSEGRRPQPSSNDFHKVMYSDSLYTEIHRLFALLQRNIQKLLVWTLTEWGTPPNPYFRKMIMKAITIMLLSHCQIALTVRFSTSCSLLAFLMFYSHCYHYARFSQTYCWHTILIFF